MSPDVPFLPMQTLYRRLGKHYPAAFFVLQLSIGLLVTAGTLALVTVYYSASDAELLRLLIITESLTLAGLTYAFARAAPRLRPLKAWIAGRRDEPSSLAAWDAAVNLPVRVFRHDVLVPCILVGVASAIAVVLVLDLGWTAALPLVVGAAIAVAYAAVLQYFAIEVGMRPVIDEIVDLLPPAFRFEQLGLPMRLKLLTILPLINIITGLVVAALTSHGDGATSLGLDVVVALGVAFTLSLELTLLLSDSVTRPLGALSRGMEAIQRGDYEVKIPVTTSDDLGELSHGFNRMAAGLAERERLREAFGTYLDKEVAEYILSQGFSPRGVEVDVSILFCDVRDFTSFASRAEATRVVGCLNQLFEVIVPIIARHGGHVDKFVGDGLLAVFGAPESYADHADRAVAAGMAIVEAVEGGEAGDLRVGVGINSGRVVAGSIGGAGRLNFSVIGDPVNVAARVEAATRETGDHLLLTAATRDGLTRDVPLVARGAPALKGKDEPVELFAVGSADGRPREAVPVAGRVPAA